MNENLQQRTLTGHEQSLVENYRQLAVEASHEASLLEFAASCCMRAEGDTWSRDDKGVYIGPSEAAHAVMRAASHYKNVANEHEINAKIIEEQGLPF